MMQAMHRTLACPRVAVSLYIAVAAGDARSSHHGGTEVLMMA